VVKEAKFCDVQEVSVGRIMSTGDLILDIVVVALCLILLLKKLRG